jgi:uncharacterized protein (TIGR01777 family)
LRFLITGATGFLGRHLWRALGPAGHEGVVLARDSGRAGALLPEARVVTWDGTTGLPPEAAFDGVDVVVNLIGESVARRWTDARKRRFRDSRVLPTRALVERMATLADKPRAFISMAGVAVYGDRGEEILTEASSPGTGEGFLLGLSRDWESAALDAAPLGVRVVVLRSGVVLGRDGGILAKVLRPFRLGLGGRLGSGRQYFPWAHVADTVGVILHAATHEALAGPVNVVAPEPVTNAEFTAALGKAVGRATPFGVPAFALKLALGEMAQEMLLSGQRISPVRVLETGYEFRFPLLAEALRDLLGPGAESKSDKPETKSETKSETEWEPTPGAPLSP